MGDDRARIDSLLEDLLEIDNHETREALLVRGCGGDSDLESKVRRLLGFAEQSAVGALDEGLGGYWREVVAGDDLVDQEGDSQAPTVAGPWQLVGEIGRGGMGTVYLGRRADGEFDQEAAVKLVAGGPQNREIVRRFELERQILAGLRHPNIAQLLDGGRTADGRPYFAMEYVEGRSLERYCDEERLSIDDRLGLFLQVARAVEHAHRNLVVHRDLKPSNIVVTEGGEVKLLDFGIAKLLQSAVGESEPLTRTMFRLLTPEYASPEQITGEAITTASDVYQLGLLLYELLTGQRAHRMGSRNLAELERAVCHEEPTRPSTLVSLSTAAAVAWSRRSEPRSLARRLHGDLDNIVLVALRKEVDQRYGSVSQLIDDIERHLAGRPVSARAPTLGYLVGKFLRRHALATVTGLAFLLLLVGYAVTVTVQSRAIRDERDRAEVAATRSKQITDFLVGTFEAADPYRNRGEELAASELIEAGAEAARAQLQDQPEVLFEMLVVLGSVSSSLGSYERAEALLTDALEEGLSLYGAHDPNVARAQIHLAAVLNDLGKTDAAYGLAEEALATFRQTRPESDPDVADALSALGTTETFRGNLEQSEILFRQALAIRERLDPRDAYTAQAFNNLGSVLLRVHNYSEAEHNHRRALALRRLVFSPEHPDVSESLNNLAVALRRQDRLEEAEPLYREALEIRRKVFGPRHLRVSNTLNNLGQLYRVQKHLDRALSSHHEALSIRREVIGEDHASVAISLHNLGITYRDAGRSTEAEDHLTRAIAMLRRTVGDGHHLLAYPTNALGQIYVDGGRLAEGSALLEEALAVREAALGPEQVLTSEVRLGLGICRAAEGRGDEAREALRAGLDTLGTAGDEQLKKRASKLLAELS